MTDAMRVEDCFAAEGVDALTRAFPRKGPKGHGARGRPVPSEEIPGRWRKLLASPRTRKTSAYFHLPFCESHCLYCPFHRNQLKSGCSEAYTDLLIAELELDRDAVALQEGPVHAVYLGGGTPTAFRPADLERLLGAIRRTLPLANDCEITVEGRAHDLEPDTVKACIAGGANRISVGVQSFDTHVRRRQGRRSSGDEVRADLERLAAFDQTVVVVDLLYGLPGQDHEVWQTDLRACAELPVDGVDLYGLELFPGTPLAQAVEAGKVESVAPLEQQARMFARGVRFFEDLRFRRLSVTHWARSTRERNLYNLFAKSDLPCLAFGSGAGGVLEGTSYMLEPDASRYASRVEAGEKPIAFLVPPDAHSALRRQVAGALARGVLDLRRLDRETGLAAAECAVPLLEQWQRAGLVEREGSWLTLTLAGQFWLDNLTAGLTGYLTGALAGAQTGAFARDLHRVEA